MSSTYTVGREVFAIRTDRGTALYLLTEKTYESNVSPQIPHWSSIYFGQASGAVARIFEHASSCEGGMLKTRSGRSSPESYIGSWLPHLATPRALPISAVCLELSDASALWARPGTIKRERGDEVIAILSEHGLADEATHLRERETCTLSLSAHGEAILAIHTRLRTSPWQLFHAPTTSYGPAEASLGIGKTQTGLISAPFKRARRLPGQETVLLQDNAGAWRAGDWPYSLVGQFVESLGANVSAVPANYAALIRAYRDHITNAPAVDAAALSVRIDTTVAAASNYEAQHIAEVAAFDGAINVSGIVTVPYTREHAYKLAHLPRNAATWIIADEPMPLFAVAS